MIFVIKESREKLSFIKGIRKGIGKISVGSKKDRLINVWW